MKTPSPKEAYALYVLGLLDWNEIPSLVSDWLTNGTYSKFLNEIYWDENLDMNRSVALFQQGMDELCLIKPSKAEAAVLIIKGELKRIANRSENPIECLTVIERIFNYHLSPAESLEVDTLLDCDPFNELYHFYFNASEFPLDFLYPGLPAAQAETQLTEDLVQLAQKCCDKFS